jgi:N-acetylmuramoyl-L-alanine amidase
VALVPIVLAAVAVDRACTGAPAAATARVTSTRTASTAAPSPTPSGQTRPVYAPGACQAQAPTGRGRNQTVFVDPGHGGPDPGVLGPRGTAVNESQVALAVAVQLAQRLRADGYRVVMSRTGDTSVMRLAPGDLENGAYDVEQNRQDLAARVRCANDSRAAALISIHFNGYTDPTVGGSQTIFDDVRPFADRSQRLADSIQEALLQQLQLHDRGVVTDDALDAPSVSEKSDGYGHLMLLGPAQPGQLAKGTVMPGVLVEPLFLTRPSEASIASGAGGQRKIAQALASGLERYLAAAPGQPTE